MFMQVIPLFLDNRNMSHLETFCFSIFLIILPQNITFINQLSKQNYKNLYMEPKEFLK